MANYHQDWDDLGRNIGDIIDRAVNSHDFQRLEQTVRQVVNRAADLGSEAARKSADRSARPASGQRNTNQTTVVERKQDLPVLYGNTNGKTAVGILKIVGGGVFSLVAAAHYIFGVIAEVFLPVFWGPVQIHTSAFWPLAWLAVGAWLIISGVRTLGKVSRYKTYLRTLGQKTQCTLEKLARSVGKNVKFVRREVQGMIENGLFRQGHLDREQTILITSDETYRNFEQHRLLLEERQRTEASERARAASVTRDPRVQEVLDRGNTFIAQIRKCNDDIPGEEISQKIYRMEDIVRRIFARAEEHPEIVPDLKKLMDYYLPMTVKLLNAYADMDAQPIQGENILASKREIEATLDTLNLAFEKILDDLFRDTAMDVSSDISVLNTLLAQEGLTEDELTKLKKQQNP